MSQALTDEQHREAQQIAELEVRRYFDYYLETVWPKQQRALQEYCDNQVQQHNQDETAHGSTEKKFRRMLWIAVGATLGGGAGGAGLLRLLMTLGGS